MKQTAEELNRKFKIATESAEMTEGEISYTIDEALTQMITISHNYAALLLSERIRLSNVTAFLKQNGFTSSAVGQPPKTTASDISLFFEKLYAGQLVSTESSKEMLELLKKQRLQNKLPKYLPSDVELAHKTGELGSYTHDAGIVYTDNGDYLIVVLSESSNRFAAEERIARLSEEMYNYFTSKE